MDGERLSELRKDKGITQKDLAKILSVSENSISLYERNIITPDDDMKIKIAKYFNVSLDYLLGITDTPSPIKSKPKIIYFNHLPEKANEELERFLKYFKSKYFKKWISMLILSLKCYTDFSDMITLLRNADMKQVRYVCDLLL